MEEVKLVGGYIRVSTQEQSQNGLSLDSQKRDIEEYCRAHGYALRKLYIDAGISARKDLYKRESFMEMMEDVRNKKINHIVIIRLDRFFRNVYDYHRMMNEYLIPCGCSWSAVREEYDTTTTNGRLMINLRLSIAEQECDQDSDRIKDVFANRIKEGYVVTGIQPMGFDIVDKRLVPNDDAAIIRDIFDSYLSTASVRKTMTFINERHNLNRSFDFYRDTITKPIYIGRHTGNDNYCEPIISVDVFNEAQRILATQQRTRSRQRDYLFKGILVCAHCGRSLCGSSPARDKDFNYYRCNGAYRSLVCDNRRNASEKKIEEYLIENIRAELEKYIITIEATAKEMPRIKGNRQAIEKKMERVKELFIRGAIDFDEFAKRKSDLESQIIEDQEPVAKDISALKSVLESGVIELYNSLTAAQKSIFWHRILKRVVCSGSEVKEIVFL